VGIDLEAATDSEAADKAMEWALKNAREVLPETCYRSFWRDEAFTAKNWNGTMSRRV
jgi:hypothetical protein